MSSTPQDYACLANDTYNDRPDDYAKSTSIAIGGHDHRVVGYASDGLTGFHAAAYRHVGSNEIVVAIRDTDTNFQHHTLTTLEDIGVDAAMVAARANPHEADAYKFVEHLLAHAKQHDIPPSQISITGHSLGDALPAIEASRFGLHGETFNAYGAAKLGHAFPTDPRQLISRVLAGDPVSATSPHPGQIYVTDTQAPFLNNSPSGHMAEVDPTQPAPAAQQSLRQIEQFNRQQAQALQQQWTPLPSVVHALHR